MYKNRELTGNRSVASYQEQLSATSYQEKQTKTSCQLSVVSCQQNQNLTTERPAPPWF